MEFVHIGKIINTHGIKGDLKIESYSDFDDLRYAPKEKIYIGEDYEPFEVLKYRKHQGYLLVMLKDYEDINLVLKYKNKNIYKAKEDIKPLEDGRYYFSDLIGLDIYQNNIKKGFVINVEEGLRNNNLRVKIDDKEVLVAFLPVFIKNVDLINKRIDVVDMEGLL